MSKSIKGDLVSDEELRINEGFKCPHCGEPFPIDIDRLATLIAKKIFNAPIAPDPIGILREVTSSTDMRNRVIMRKMKVENES